MKKLGKEQESPKGMLAKPPLKRHTRVFLALDHSQHTNSDSHIYVYRFMIFTLVLHSKYITI